MYKKSIVVFSFVCCFPYLYAFHYRKCPLIRALFLPGTIPDDYFIWLPEGLFVYLPHNNKNKNKGQNGTDFSNPPLQQ